MAKPKSPLLSLGARGTIADTLTFQKRGQDTIVREKPIPKDPYTLNQAYQRWLYQDYAYLWTLETEASKQSYRTRASRYHITGFSLWMREHLRDLTYILGYWKLDSRTGAVAFDSSRNALNGTIYGASPIPGHIDHSRYFDGLNDYIMLGNSPLLSPSAPFTIEGFTKPDFINAWSQDSLFHALQAGLYHSKIGFNATGQLRFDVWRSQVSAKFAMSPVGTPDVWQHFAGTFDGTTLLAYCKGIPGTAVNWPYPMNDVNPQVKIGVDTISWRWFEGAIDHVILWSIALDATTIKRHSLRRYPP